MSGLRGVYYRDVVYMMEVTEVYARSALCSVAVEQMVSETQYKAFTDIITSVWKRVDTCKYTCIQTKLCIKSGNKTILVW